jgi:hypothetical protein
VSMAMAPFGTRPLTPGRTPASESRRTRLAVIIAMLGIAATLLAYAVSPGVRHAVSHAAHSVKHAVSRVLDHDTTKRAPAKRPAPAKARSPARTTHHAARSGSAISGGFTISTTRATPSR